MNIIYDLDEFDYFEIKLYGKDYGFDEATRTRNIVQCFENEQDDCILILNSMVFYYPEDKMGHYVIHYGISKQKYGECVSDSNHFTMTELKDELKRYFLYNNDIEQYGGSNSLIDLIIRAIRDTDLSLIKNSAVIFLEKSWKLVGQDAFFKTHTYYIDRIILEYTVPNWVLRKQERDDAIFQLNNERKLLEEKVLLNKRILEDLCVNDSYVGKTIEHFKFGRGIIISYNGKNIIEAVFDKKMKKKVDIDYSLKNGMVTLLDCNMLETRNRILGLQYENENLNNEIKSIDKQILQLSEV